MNFCIAIPYSQDEVFQHFGKSSQFKIYTVADGAVASTEVLDTAGVGHEDLALWLVQHSVQAVVCGGIGPGAQGALAAAGIAVFAGVEGAADEAARRLLAGELAPAGGANCHGGGSCSHCSKSGSCGCH
ncbi:MAG: NifB/NifX family molybdenum-iron cluster-binding protein [Kiritimatiellae bacterium]|nr:NifB/NifX family molybdenum-iron cluster-binding protein [Kiritimatiellia bacterium]